MSNYTAKSKLTLQTANKFVIWIFENDYLPVIHFGKLMYTKNRKVFYSYRKLFNKFIKQNK